MRSTNELRTVVVIIFANAKQMRATDPLKPFMDIISEEAGASGMCVGDVWAWSQVGKVWSVGCEDCVEGDGGQESIVGCGAAQRKIACPERFCITWHRHYCPAPLLCRTTAMHL